MLIKVEGLYFNYMNGTPLEVKVLKNINFQVAKGEFLGIIGSTGSGKSTLAQHLNGLLFPIAGQVLVEGRPVGRLPLPALRRKIGLVFQYPEQHLFAETVFEDISFAPRNAGLKGKEVESRVKESLDMVGLGYDEYHNRSPFTLSGGEMRRVAIAGVLAMQPDVLVLDEPTAGLDPHHRTEFLRLIHNFHQRDKKTVIMVSHNMAEVSMLCNRIIVLHNGELVLQGSRHEVFSCRASLLEYGIDLPPLNLLIEELRARGLELPADTYTPASVCRKIYNLITGAAN